MSRKSNTVLLTTTITLTVFVAALVLFFNPNMGLDSYSSQVLNEAIERQNTPLINVTQPLVTDTEVIREEEKMAQKVSEILQNDESFISNVGDSSVGYIDSRMGEIEEKYSQNMIDRINSVDQKREEAVASLSSRVLSDEEIVNLLLEDEAFVTSLASLVADKTGVNVSSEDIARSVVDSAVFKEYLDSLTPTSVVSIPLPLFSAGANSELTESEYIALRENKRSYELDRMMDFLGY